MIATFGAHSNDTASVISSRFGDASTSSCSHAATSNGDDYRILQPDDFKRVKSQISLRSRPFSATDNAFDLPASPRVPPTSSNTINPSSVASLLPPDFDLVIRSRPHQLAQRQSRDRATFGPSEQDSDESDAEPIAIAPTELESKSLYTIEQDSDSESMIVSHDAAQDVRPPEPVLETSFPSPSSVQDATLNQLKQQADEVWASHRSAMASQQRSSQPAQVSERPSSTRRSSLIVLNALPSNDAEQPRSSVVTTPSTHSHSSSQSTRLNSEAFPRLSASVSHGSGTIWRGPPSSDLHVHRPYTASILSSTSEHSFLSYQHSFESGMSPLLLDRSAAAGRVLGRPQRPVTSGSIPLNIAAAPHFASSARPDTTNQLTAEQRRQQVRRTKKLTQMLGEEMLLASSAAHTDSHSSHVRASARIKPRPQSRQIVADVASAPASTSAAGSKTRSLSRKLLHNRSHAVKSVDRAFSDMIQPPPPPPPQAPVGLNRKAAAILGIPHHPYSSSAQSRESGEEMLAGDDEELNIMRQTTARNFIPSGLEEFNEPTPKVAQLAAFSAAALDEGASPTLPHDGVFRAFDQSHLEHALAMSESRKLAAARDERRRRVAKMSRWLGEAVPAELIMAGADQRPNAVIRSTRGPTPSQSLSSHDTALYTASETSRTRRSVPTASVDTVSSIDHGTISHEGSVASNLQSFISIDSSDDEADDEVAPVAAEPVVQHVADGSSALVAPSPSSAASALPDSMSAYRTSLDSYEVLLNENDHERLSELASIFHDTRAAASSAAPTRRVTLITRPPRSPDRPVTSPAAPHFAPVTRRQLVDASDSPAVEPALLSSSVGGIPRRSAAFLDLTDSESDSSDADEELHDIDDVCYSSALRQQRLDSHDRSISKLSNFFGSTPSQIVRSQTDIAAACSANSIVDLKEPIKPNRRQSANKPQPDALKTILRSLEEEALDDSTLTHIQKSEISRKVHLLKRRTTKMFA